MSNYKDNPKTATVTLRITKENKAILEKLAKSRKIKVGTIAAEIIESYIANM